VDEFSLQELLSMGEDGLRPELVARLPKPWRLREDRGIGYDLDDPGLIAAIKAALLLGQPLIVAGDPGVGKTALSNALADRLGLFLHDPHQVKSTTTGLDLFYGFDEVARFRDANRGVTAEDGEAAEQKGLSRYVRFSSLGRAILWSAGPDAKVALGSVTAREILGSGQKSTAVTLGELFPSEFDVARIDRNQKLTRHRVAQSTRSVVLLDELDKAPRDSPNDVLGELETLSFRIAELDLTVRASPDAWPVLLITSNSERSLPDAFLRRCIFHWIDFPSEARLQKIAASRCAIAHEIDPKDKLVSSAVKLFIALRTEVENKQPSTAEMIAFLAALIESGFARDKEISRSDKRVEELFGIMVKTRTDRETMGLA